MSAELLAVCGALGDRQRTKALGTAAKAAWCGVGGVYCSYEFVQLVQRGSAGQQAWIVLLTACQRLVAAAGHNQLGTTCAEALSTAAEAALWAAGWRSTEALNVSAVQRVE